jgi:putative pyruvate formate lyase activating enzyme
LGVEEIQSVLKEGKACYTITLPRTESNVETHAPNYLLLHQRRKLVERIEEALDRLDSCQLCPRDCKKDRTEEEVGFCGAGRLAKVASANLHQGEEPPLVGKSGSGTIFFSHCSLRCCFCQNYPISHLGNGREMHPEGLARMMLDLQERGAANINFVTGSHFLPQILEALPFAIEGGLRLPLVYNCGGYESVEALHLLDGIIDIYLPDAKYGDPEVASVYSKAPDYVEINRAALKEMYRQVGDLRKDDDGTARRGLIVRHLILPGQIRNTRKVLRFLAQGLSPAIHISLMSQYFPANEAESIPALRRKVNRREARMALKMAMDLGLEKGWHQEE